MAEDADYTSFTQPEANRRKSAASVGRCTEGEPTEGVEQKVGGKHGTPLEIAGSDGWDLNF